jgi:RHS repeat-associated protein
MTSHPQGQFSSPSFTGTAGSSSLSGGTNSSTTTQGATIYSLTMAYAPNGDVTATNDSANGNWTYSYDDFNRLTGSNKNSGQQTYNYVYDRFGNRWQQNAPQGGNTMLATFSNLNTSTNTSSPNNRMDGFSYDASGNLLSDTANTYTYDAESRITQIVGSSGTTTYSYDASGRRVRKTVAGVSTDYVYDLEGHAIAETNSSGAWTRGEVYVGGRHLATYSGGAAGTTYFAQSDALGTERIRSNVAGAACETIASLPFGDGLSSTGSCGDPSTRHFTGKERDSESGLDDFGARYYSSQFGRFVSADWSAVPVPVPYADLTNPQSLNLYALVKGNPETFADLDGHQAEGAIANSESGNIAFRWPGGGGGSAACILDGSCGSTVIVGYELTVNGQSTGAAQPQNQGPVLQEPQNRQEAELSNVIYNETSGLRPNPEAKPGEVGSAEDLHNGRVAVGEIANRLLNSDHPEREQARNDLSDRDRRNINAGNADAINAHNDSLAAVRQVLAGSNTTNGATQFRTRVGNNTHTPVGYQNIRHPGTPVSQHFGTFVDVGGRRPVPAVIVVAP